MPSLKTWATIAVYFVTYYSNANTAGVPDATLRIVNDGDAVCTGMEIAKGNVICDSINDDIRNPVGGDLRVRRQPGDEVVLRLPNHVRRSAFGVRE